MPVDYVQPLLSMIIGAVLVLLTFEYLRRRQPSDLPRKWRGGQAANGQTLTMTLFATPPLLIVAFLAVEGFFRLLRAG